MRCTMPCVASPSARLNALAPALGLDVVARRGLQSRSIGGRILAIRTLGHLRDPSAWKAMQEQLASSNALVSFYAAAALVLIDAQRAMPGIMNQLAERESWPGEAMARLLVDAGADIAREPIRALMLSLGAGKMPPLLPWLVARGCGARQRSRDRTAAPESGSIVEHRRRGLARACWTRRCCRRSRVFASFGRCAISARTSRVAYGRLGGLGRDRDAHAADERQRLVGALPRGAGIAEAERHGRRAARGGACAAHATPMRATCCEHVQCRGGVSHERCAEVLTAVQWGFSAISSLLNVIYLGLAFIAL